MQKTYTLIRENFAQECPHLCGYKRFLRCLHQLNGIVRQLFVQTASFYQSEVFLLADKPIPVCQPTRHRRVRLLREDGAYFGKTSKGWFFGFKLHALTTIDKKVCQLILTPANDADRTVAEALTGFFNGFPAVGDLAYRGQKLQTQLWEENGWLLITKQDAKQKGYRLPPIRQHIEAGFSILWHHFIDCIFSRF